MRTLLIILSIILFISAAVLAGIIVRERFFLNRGFESTQTSNNLVPSVPAPPLEQVPQEEEQVQPTEDITPVETDSDPLAGVTVLRSGAFVGADDYLVEGDVTVNASDGVIEFSKGFSLDTTQTVSLYLVGATEGSERLVGIINNTGAQRFAPDIDLRAYDRVLLRSASTTFAGARLR